MTRSVFVIGPYIVSKSFPFLVSKTKQPNRTRVAELQGPRGPCLTVCVCGGGGRAGVRVILEVRKDHHVPTPEQTVPHTPLSPALSHGARTWRYGWAELGGMNRTSVRFGPISSFCQTHGLRGAPGGGGGCQAVL